VGEVQTTFTLRQLGWQTWFSAQIAPDEAALVPGRVFAVRRRGLTVEFEGGEVDIPLAGRWFQLPAEERPTIGDWVLLSVDHQLIVRLLTRKSVLKRLAAGRNHELQLMAANIDTMFLVTSCNEEFNRSRVERYLALALDAGVQPVVVLTKADQAEAPEAYRDAVRALMRDLPVELVNALAPSSLDGVRSWCHEGQTVALLGSSGVGKSTIVNSLAGASLQATGDIRADDAKGRHTTTHRSLHLLPDGGLLVDNPGLRELTLGDVDRGVVALFEDIQELLARCRFGDCRHASEPGCAVREALADGSLDPRRLDNYQKLVRDDSRPVEPTTDRQPRPRSIRQSREQKHRKRP